MKLPPLWRVELDSAHPLRSFTDTLPAVKHRPSGSHAVVLLLCVLMAACITHTRREWFEVRRGASIEEKVGLATLLVTEARLAQLKLELKQKHPDLTDAQLEKIGVGWNENWMSSSNGKTNRWVTITVAMQEQAGANTADVVTTAIQILDAEINGPEYTAIDSKATR